MAFLEYAGSARFAERVNVILFLIQTVTIIRDFNEPELCDICSWRRLSYTCALNCHLHSRGWGLANVVS